jgi:hypothetical protein
LGNYGASELLISKGDAFERERRESKGRTGNCCAHASLKVTADVYMQAVSPQKREAQSKLVKMVMKTGVSLIGPNWTMKENGDCAEPVYFVGVPDGI